jgi:ParB family chromosome partitioning protein
MARRPGLGRGLDALIPGNEEQQDLKSSIPTQGILQVSVDSIHPNPQQPRTHMDQEALEDLSASIQEHGIIQPLIVSEDEDGQTYTLIAGERRWRAAKLAGLSLVPVIERSVSEQGQLELALIENLQRMDLSPLEMAEAYRQLAENFSLTHDQIAQRVGKSRTSVTNTLRLLSLSDAAKSALAEDKISEGHARALLGLSKPQAQDAALQTVLNLSLNVRQTEALVKKLNGEKPPSTPKPEPAPEILALENKLRSFFGTKVHLNKSGKGGSLVIYYYSEEELNTILDKFLTE